MGKYKVSFLPDAENDLDEILQWYNFKNPSKVQDFLNEIDKHYQNLQDYPNMFPDDFLFVKKAIFRKFPYKICFVTDDIDFEVVIIGVLHQKRDGRILRQRINFE